MKKKISDKDKKDWQNFIESNEKVVDKDLSNINIKPEILEKTIDLHGFSLDNANRSVKEFIEKSYDEGINKINVITGKGSRSNNSGDPFKSEKLGILKYSVPEYIKSNQELMLKIQKINFDDINSSLKGSFEIILKKFKNNNEKF